MGVLMESLIFGWISRIIFRKLQLKDKNALLERFNDDFKEDDSCDTEITFTKLLQKHGKNILVAAVIKLFSEVLTVLSVHVTKTAAQRIKLVVTSSNSAIADLVPILIILLSMQLLNTFLMNHHEFIMSKTGLKCSRLIVRQLYRRTLSSSPDAVIDEGRFVNMLTVDASRVESMFTNLHYIWSAPIQCMLIFWSMYELIGVVALFGIGIMLLYLPFQACMTVLLKSFRQRIFSASDKRVSVLEHFFRCIKSVQTMNIEPVIASRIKQFRQDEVCRLKRFHLIRSFSQSLNIFFAVVASAGTILILLYRKIGPGAINLVIVLTLFKILRVQLNMIPLSLNALADGLTSLKRFSDQMNNCLAGELTDFVDGLEHFQLIFKDRMYRIKKGDIVSIEGSNAHDRSQFLRTTVEALSLISKAGYCPENPWLQNRSIKENIIFNRSEIDEVRYRRAVQVCELEQDLEALHMSDSTVVGQNGVNLSGGQRQRICLARVVYSDAKVWIIDDIFASLDIETSRRILENCFVCKPEDVTILMIGNSEYASMTIHLSSSQVSFSQSKTSDTSIYQPSLHLKKKESAVRAKLVETQKKGQISLKVLLRWLRLNGGVAFLIACFVLLLAINQCRIGSEVLVAEHRIFNSWLVALFCSYSLGQFVLPLIKSVLFTLSGLRASTRLHSKSIDALLHAPYLKHTEKPISMLINRLSKDQESIDNGLIISSSAFSVMAGVLFFTAITIASKNWKYTGLPVAFVLTVYFVLSAWYRYSTREAKRYESVSRTPICTQASELSKGLAIIQGLRGEEPLFAEFEKLIDTNCSFRYFMITAQVWFTLRIEIIGAFLTFLVGICAALCGMEPALAGLVLSYSSSLSGLTMWTIRQLAHFETNLVAFERLNDLTDEFKAEPSLSAVPEKKLGLPGDLFELKRVFAHFGELEYLRGITLSFEAGKKTAIIGRTGSGKSSLLLTLLKIYPLSSGSISYNGQDIADLNTAELRRQVAYVPQEAYLFVGESFRFNLDPKGNICDSDIWLVLKCLRMTDIRLEDIFEGDLPASTREVICLARALLMRCETLLMDEPLASLSSTHLQGILADPYFLTLIADKTMIIVTHRPELVSFCDRTVRLSAGHVLA